VDHLRETAVVRCRGLANRLRRTRRAETSRQIAGHDRGRCRLLGAEREEYYRYPCPPGVVAKSDDRRDNYEDAGVTGTRRPRQDPAGASEAGRSAGGKASRSVSASSRNPVREIISGSIPLSSPARSAGNASPRRRQELSLLALRAGITNYILAAAFAQRAIEDLTQNEGGRGCLRAAQ
jgi:hypothetical protein